MTERTVRSYVDIDNPPPLSADERAQLEQLSKLRDADIDTSDIPETDFSNAVRLRDSDLYRVLKQSTTVRIDADVLMWLRAKGKGYQTRINAILREAMAKEVG